MIQDKFWSWDDPKEADELEDLPIVPETEEEEDEDLE